MKTVDLRELAAQMIERLVDCPETGECQICLVKDTATGNPHACDCEAMLIVQGLRKSVQQ